jgi:[ribosomal protein S5]-alanine N-acetyltransferase
MNSFNQVKLHTDRLLLRPLQESDAPALLVIFSNEKVMQYWSTPPWDSIDIAQTLISRDLKAMAAGEYICLGIERLEDHVLIGTVTLFNLDKQCRRAEIGYGMAHPAWGKGYMHEALSALLDFGFSELKLNRVEADIDPRNLASAKSLERLGFNREGYLRERWIVDGVVSDTALYGLLVREWKNTTHI